MSKLFSDENKAAFTGPLNVNNPVAVQVLGICSALAVTSQLKPAIVMGLSVTVITAFSNVIISLLRKTIPNRIRIIVQLVVVAALVTPWPSFLDGIGNGLGYAAILVIVGFVRELFGFGTLFGYNVIPQFMYDAGYQNNGMMVMPAMSLIIVGLVIWGHRAYNKES